jgi:hypothetical protein
VVFLTAPLGIERARQIGIEPGDGHGSWEHGEPFECGGKIVRNRSR